jgi:DNA-directed RNA polymerase subunit RPC12/RpoP
LQYNTIKKLIKEKSMQKYICKNCDAELYWDVESGCLKCEYCDSTYKPSDFKNQTSEAQDAEKANKAEEGQEATDGTLNADELVVYKCLHCGAEIVTSAGTVATTCGYCGRAISFSSKLTNPVIISACP